MNVHIAIERQVQFLVNFQRYGGKNILPSVSRALEPDLFDSGVSFTITEIIEKIDSEYSFMGNFDYHQQLNLRNLNTV